MAARDDYGIVSPTLSPLDAWNRDGKMGSMEKFPFFFEVFLN